MLLIMLTMYKLQLTGILYLSLLIVNEKQQEITLPLVDVVVVVVVAVVVVVVAVELVLEDLSELLFKRHEVKTAFCPGSKAIFPYFF